MTYVKIDSNKVSKEPGKRLITRVEERSSNYFGILVFSEYILLEQMMAFIASLNVF